ncbi:MAG: hypothetical protein ACJAV7_003126, partial [Flavobacteriales bacterium]
DAFKSGILFGISIVELIQFNSAPFLMSVLTSWKWYSAALKCRAV